MLVCRHTERSTESKLAKGEVVKAAGGVGMILIDETDKDVAIPFNFPAAIVGKRMGNRILSYINSTRFITFTLLNYLLLIINVVTFNYYVPNIILIFFIYKNSKATTRIFASKAKIGSQPAPRVASFSSKGPNALTPEILKVTFYYYYYYF